MDHIEKAIARSEIYDESFFSKLNDCRGRIVYIIACRIPLLDQMNGVFPDRHFFEDVTFEEIQLGKISLDEAKRFVEKNLMEEVELAHFPHGIESLIGVAGLYPLFLESAVVEVKDSLMKNKAGEYWFDSGELEQKLVEKKKKDYQEIWRALCENERAVLQSLVSGGSMPKQDRGRFRSLWLGGLIVELEGPTFSTAFDRYIQENSVNTGTRLKRQRKIRRFLMQWNRGRTLTMMVFLVLVYSIMLPILTIMRADTTWLQYSPMAFLLIFAIFGLGSVKK